MLRFVADDPKWSLEVDVADLRAVDGNVASVRLQLPTGKSAVFVFSSGAHQHALGALLGARSIAREWKDVIDTARVRV